MFERDARCCEVMTRYVGMIVIYKLSVDLPKGDGFA